MPNHQSVLSAVLIASTLVGAWLGMQAVHELGHVLGAWATGGEVQRVVLDPLSISRTDVANSRSPGVVIWAGPVVGAAVPVAAWLAATAIGWHTAFLLRFFAGFCLVANGLYIGLGSFGRVGDCGEMLRHGASPWQLWLFGLTAVPAGLWLWNGQGRHFGIGPNAKPVRPAVAYGSLVVCLALVVNGLAFGR